MMITTIFEEALTNHKVYGEEMVILAGDALLSHAFEYIARETKGVLAEKILRVIADVGKCVGSEGLVGGRCGHRCKV